MHCATLRGPSDEIFFARRVAHLVKVSSALDPDGDIRVYAVTGELFVASTNEIMHSFDYADTVSKVVIGLNPRGEQLRFKLSGQFAGSH